MTYALRPSRLFLQQAAQLTEPERLLVAEKLQLAKLNPFRYKSLFVPGLTKVFEIKITLQGLYSRIVYVLEGQDIRVACIINRKNDFRDLVKLLYKARQEK